MYSFEHTKVKVPDSRLYLFSRCLVDSGFAHIKKLYGLQMLIVWIRCVMLLTKAPPQTSQYRS